jgi:hypothetical protein
VSVIVLLTEVSGDLRTYGLRLIYNSEIEGSFKAKNSFKAAIAVKVVKRRRPLDFIKQSVIL